MSKYGKTKTTMKDVDRLREAIERTGITEAVYRGRRITIGVYPDGNGVYKKWAGDQIRGKDAVLVVHGGLDSRGFFCGDTAFVREPDGTLRAEIDTAHGNAPAIWEMIKNLYALIPHERAAKAAGYNVQIDIDPETGKVSGRYIQTRPTASRTQAPKATVRPAANRPMGAGR